MFSKTDDFNFNGALGNCVEGVITEMVQMRSNAQVTIDAGFLVKTRVSLSSIKNLNINIGDKIHVCFKADALNIFAENSNK